MIDLPLVLLGGMLGSAHCIGMCGPLAVMLGSGSDRLSINLRRQVVYTLGRIFTYCFCGAVAGFAGAWLASQGRTLVLSQAWLAIGAGAALAVVGLASTGTLPRLSAGWLAAVPCSTAQAVKTMLTTPQSTSLFLAGAATGFIPCGLVYAFLLKAGSTGSVWLGGATMAAFGLGTAPMMIAVGGGGSLLSLTARTKALRLAAWCVVMAGIVTAARGAVQLRAAPGEATAPCPLCAAAE